MSILQVRNGLHPEYTPLVNFDPFQIKLTTLDDCQEMLSSDSLIPDADADAAYDGHIQHRLRPCGSCKDLDS